MRGVRSWRGRLGRLPLTEHLKNKRSPVRRYFDKFFPNTRGFPRLVRAALSGVARIEPPVAMKSGELGLVGMAIDYRIRYYFAPYRIVKGSPAASGLKSFAASTWSKKRLARYQSFLESHNRYIADLKPQGRLLERADEEELNRRCVVLAMFEQLYRMGLFAIGKTWLDRNPRNPLAIAEQPWIEDLCRMSEAAYAAIHARLSEPHHLNPKFEGSRDLARSDADLIAGRTLVEIKAYKDPTRRSNLQLYQILGYALLDYSDKFELDRLGLYFARYGALVEWPVDVFLAELGAKRSLAQHRKEFEALLKGA